MSGGVLLLWQIFDFMWGGGREHGDKSDDCGRNALVYHVYPVSRRTEGTVEGGGGGGRIPTALGRINVYMVGTYYTCYTQARKSARFALLFVSLFILGFAERRS